MGCCQTHLSGSRKSVVSAKTSCDELEVQLAKSLVYRVLIDQNKLPKNVGSLSFAVGSERVPSVPPGSLASVLPGRITVSSSAV